MNIRDKNVLHVPALTFLPTSGKKYKIFEYSEPEHDKKPFIVFNSCYTNKKVKTIHVVSMAKRKSTKIVLSINSHNISNVGKSL